MNTALDVCLRAPTDVPSCASVAEWWPRWRQGAALAATTAEQALRGGFDADRVAWAFACGYQAALRALLPQLPADALAAFCVTEETGNRPRDIRTRITAHAGGTVTLSGTKRWTMLGPDSSVLLVAGVMGPAAPNARALLKVARVAVGSPGLQLLPMAPTRFVPEVPHARIVLDEVRVDAGALLPGDGYERYVKPFRTHEDIHVTLAVLAYLLRETRQRRWPGHLAERLCATITVLCELAACPADAASTHVVMAGALAQAHVLFAEAGTLWAELGDDPAAQRWQRDAALFGVAGAARSQRTARAWERLQGSA
jgi:hypothetical protein